MWTLLNNPGTQRRPGLQGRSVHPRVLRLASLCCRPSSPILSRLSRREAAGLPCPALPSKPLAGGVCVHLTQVGFDQAQGLLNEVVELVDLGQGVDTDD